MTDHLTLRSTDQGRPTRWPFFTFYKTRRTFKHQKLTNFHHLASFLSLSSITYSFLLSVRPYGKYKLNARSYLHTPYSTVLLEKLTGPHLLKKFPAIYGTRRLITAFTSARYLSVPWDSSIQSIYPHPTSSRSISIISFHVRLGLPSGLFSQGFPTKTLL